MTKNWIWLREALALTGCAVPRADHIFLQYKTAAKYVATVVADTDPA